MFDDFSVILQEVGRGAIPRYEHIYFLDRSRCVLSDFEKIRVGLGGWGSKTSKVQSQAQGAWHRVCLVCAGGGLWTAVAEQKPKVCAKARADASQYAIYSLFSGMFNWPRNHDETEVKITMKSRI